MNARWLALGLLVAVGCGGTSDPCAGKSDACIAVHVKGTAPGLDQLSVTVDVPTVETKLTPTTPKATSLPLDFAVLLPAGTTGDVHVTVDGLVAGTPRYADMETATLVSNRAKITITLGGTTGGDGGGVDLAGDDLSGCGVVTACVAGDGCCPAGCTNTTDSDCAAVCGNGVVEAGEVCDDHNLVNGDTCDPTCQFGNKVTTISGVAGSEGFADSPAPRFSMPQWMAYDAAASTLYVGDNGTSVIRKIDSSPTVSTIVGTAYGQGVNGQSGGFSAATFSSHYVFFLHNASGGPSLGMYDKTANTTTFLPLIFGATDLLTGIASTATELYIVDSSTGGPTLYQWNYTDPANPVMVAATAAQIHTALGATVNCTGVTITTTGTIYLGCGSLVAKVVNPGATPTITSYLGSTTHGCSGTTFSTIDQITQDSSGNLLLPDWLCDTVDLSSPGTSVFAGASNMAGYFNITAGDVFTMDRFNQPRGIVQYGNSLYYVLDSGNDAIRNLTANETTTYVGAPMNLAEVLDVKANARYGVGMVGLATDGATLYALDVNGKLIAITITSGDSTKLFDFGSTGRALVRIGATLYVALANGTVHSIGMDGKGDTLLVGTAGTTSPPANGTGIAAVLDPYSLATDGTDLYFMDSSKLLRKIVVATNAVSLVAGQMGSMKVADGASPSFGDATGDLVYANGALYRMDADTTQQGAKTGLLLRKIDLASLGVTTIAGTASQTPTSADGTGVAATFAGVQNFTTDGTSLFLFDSGQVNHSDRAASVSATIRQMTLADTAVTTMIGKRGQWTSYDAVGTGARVNGNGPMLFDGTTHATYFFDNAEGVFRRIK